MRQLAISDNIRAWLTAYPADKYPIIPKNYQDLITSIRKKFQLPHDVLRHTRISMHVRKCKSIGAAALEAGNTEAVIRQYYLNLVTDADAEVFWDITPDSIRPDSATLAKIEAAVAEIEKRKAGGEKEIDADIVRQIYEDIDRESWGRAEMENTVFERHERQGWQEDYLGQIDRPIL